MLAVPAVFHVVQVVACLLAQEAQLLGTSYVELLPTARLVALHARAHLRLRALVQLLTNVAGCGKTQRKQKLGQAIKRPVAE